MASQSVKNNRLGCFIFLVLFVLVGIVHGAVRYFADKPIYEEAHAAYLIGDCDKAIPLYDEIIEKFRTMDFRDIKEKSISENSECNIFIAAAENSLEAIYYFTQDFPDSPLVKYAGAKVTEIIEGLTDSNDLSQELGGESCTMNNLFVKAGLLTEGETLLKFHFFCARKLIKEGDIDNAFERILVVLKDYPQSTMASLIWTSFFTTTDFCSMVQRMRYNDTFTTNSDFLPEFFLSCGDNYSAEFDYDNALISYQAFLDLYPTHPLVEEILPKIAALLVTQAKTGGAGTIERPDSSGWAPSGVARVVIQNDSPHTLKLVFSGEDARIEVLEPCPTCIDYSTVGPIYCPEEGPMETYELTPGTYEVLVEASDEGGVIPFTGTWELEGGNEFYSCFFVVTSWN